MNAQLYGELSVFNCGSNAIGFASAFKWLRRSTAIGFASAFKWLRRSKVQRHYVPFQCLRRSKVPKLRSSKCLRRSTAIGFASAFQSSNAFGVQKFQSFAVPMPAAFQSSKVPGSKVPKFHVPGEVRIHNTILYSITQSLYHSIAQSLNRSIAQSLNRLVAPSLPAPSRLSRDSDPDFNLNLP